MKEKKSAGRPTERLAIEGNWKDAVKRFVTRNPNDTATPSEVPSPPEKKSKPASARHKGGVGVQKKRR